MGNFLRYDRPIIASMVNSKTPDRTIELIGIAIAEGADAVGIQTDGFLPEYRNIEEYRRVLAAANGLPTYVTHYRTGDFKLNSDNDENIGEHLVEIARIGATLVDVMGDLYCKDPLEMTFDPVAVEKQKKLIERLHEEGAEVIMSSHALKYLPAEQVLEMANAQVERGADIVKIVTFANSEEEEVENLKTSLLLKRELKKPFLFLAGGECKIHRRLGPSFGASMWLCDAAIEENGKTPVRPLISQVKAIAANLTY